MLENKSIVSQIKWAFSIVLGIFLLQLSSCESVNSNGDPVITYAADSAFSDTSEVAIQLSEGIQIDLWAPGTLLAGPVAISIDNQGVAYVSETDRRKSSDIDIRQHRDWMTEDLGLQTIEQTEAFHKQKLDPALGDQNTWQEDFNGDGSHDWRDLTVESERIRRIWDEDGDGVADASNIFAKDINGMLTGVAAGILSHEENVFLTAAPDVYRFRDKDNDGDADEREIISHGYGIHIAYAGHDMSGLAIGPDGKIYWSIGDIGVNVVDKNGKRWAYPNQGAVMRCNPDGSEFEVFAHGLRNPQELAFDAFGNLISVDNDGDHSGERERIVHITEDSDAGWRINWQFGKYNKPYENYKVWMDEKLYIPHFPGQAAYITPPLALAPDGPAGLVYNPGTALGEKWNNYFFGSYFKGSDARSLIHAFKLKPKNSSFEVEDEKILLKGISSTGLAFGPDGSLYIADWLNGYDVKSVGRVWKLDIPPSERNSRRAETNKILAGGTTGLSAEELKDLMFYEDMRVRMEAQFELVKRGEKEILSEVLEQKDNLLARLHAIWGIGQIGRKDQIHCKVLESYLNDPEAEVRAQVAKVMGDAKYEDASEQLLQQLNDENDRAKFFAAEALGKISEEKAFDGLVDLLVYAEERDTHLRHAAMLALSRSQKVENLEKLATHPNKYVRIGAVVALRKMASPSLSAFLNDEDPLVVTEAARAIHDDMSVPGSMEDLAKAIQRSDITNEAFLRRAINANLRLGDAKSARRLAGFAQNKTMPEEMRADALWALSCWNKPPILDRVDGRHRDTLPHDPKVALTAIQSALPDLLTQEKGLVQKIAAEVSGKLNFVKGEIILYALFLDEKENSETRQASLRSLVSLNSPNMLIALENALSSKDEELRKTAQELLGEADLPAPQLVAMLSTALENSSVAEQQKIFPSLANIDDPEAENLLGVWLEKLKKGEVAIGSQLDLEMAIEASSFPALKSSLKTYQQELESVDPIASFKGTLEGGNRRRGMMLFYTNTSAQCVRCHIVNGMGGEVGPELSHIASELSREELLASMIEPSERIAPGYGTVALTLNNGDKFAGTLMGESQKEVKLILASGEEKEVTKSKISERKEAPSAMPSIQGILSKPEIRDILAFLVSLK